MDLLGTNCGSASNAVVKHSVVSVFINLRCADSVCLLESCAGRVNPRGLRVPAFAGRVQEPALLCVRGGLNLLRGGLYLVRVWGGRKLRNSLCA